MKGAEQLIYRAYRTSSSPPYLPELYDVSSMSQDEASLAPVPVETVLYYYGNVSRETAEWILWDRGCQDGMYLLRESNQDYVLSLCFQKSVLHYRIKKLPTGDVGLFGVPHQMFPGPVELVEGVEGLACKPTIPCNKSLDANLPLTHWGLSQDDIRQAITKKGQEWGLNEAELMLSMSEDHNDVKHLIIKTLHEIQPWFHGHLSRAEAEKRLLDSGHKDGKFLVRERNDSSYAFCLSHSGCIKHYKIDVLPSGEFAIQDGQRFPSILALVSHYSLFSDGLWCALTEPCWNKCLRQERPPPDPPLRISPIPDHRAKVTNGRHSPGILGSPSGISRPSKLNQKGLFTKLVQTVSPHSENNSPTSSSVASPARDKSTTVPASPSITGTPPPHTRKPSGTFSPTMREDKRSMQKASSFDLIPAFFSALFFPGESESEQQRRQRKRISDARKNSTDSCNGYRSEFYVDIEKIDKPPPAERVKAPINYANKDIFSVRSCSLGEPGEEVVEVAPPPASPSSFIRSASSPSVVSQGGARPKPPPRPPHLVPSTDEGNDLEDEEAVKDGPPAPPPRRKVDVVFHNGNSSPDGSSTTSPLLTEDSASIPGSPLNENCLESVDQSKDFLLISFDSPPPLPPERSTDEDSTRNGSLLTDELVEQPDPTYATLSGDTRLLGAFTDDGLLDEQQQQESGETLPVFSREESELAYQTLRRCRRGPVNLDPNAIVLKDKIGCGNFGEVWCGAFSSGSLEVQFAVKMLKSSVAHQKSEILEEAQTMAALDHPHIVRLIGVCEGDPFMLVMELAPLGPLNKFLKNHMEMSLDSILLLLVQVACAMEYLESSQYVHRDLAARNILLVNESFAKISDFGMSRALGLGKEYYKAETAGKWPLKWYAPECIYFFKFSTKSDIWSFGVTMWEALSHGSKPYKGMAGRDILQMFDRNQRLSKPAGCPDDVYNIMWSCWRYRPEDRPDFAEVHHRLQQCASCDR